MNEENYIKFSQYIDNEMTDEEKTSFEKQLSQDPKLTESFKIFEELNLHLTNKFGNATELNAFKQNVKSISAEHFITKKAKVIQLKSWYYSVAASVAVLVGLFIFMQNNNPNFEDYNHHENAYFTERGTIDNELKMAQDAFNSKKYKEAITNFEKVLKQNESPEIQLFYAISLVEDNQFQKADVHLMDLKLGNSVFKNKAIWYLALSKLKQKDYKSCKEILRTIPSDYEAYEQVKQLLNELD
jgi:predicted Zn-dependent protease